MRASDYLDHGSHANTAGGWTAHVWPLKTTCLVSQDSTCPDLSRQTCLLSHDRAGLFSQDSTSQACRERRNH